MKATGLFLASVGLVLSACSSSKTTSAGAGGTGTTSGNTTTTGATSGTMTSTTGTATSTASSGTSTATSSSTGIATVNFPGTVEDMVTSNPISGAKACVYLHPELACVTSDAMGKFNLQLPSSTNTGFLLDATGYQSVLLAIQTFVTPNQPAVVQMLPTAKVQTFYTAAMSPYPDPSNGFLLVFMRFNQNGEPNSTAKLVPVSGKGPFFADATLGYGAGLTTTSSAGQVHYGSIPPVPMLEVDGKCDLGFTQRGYFGWSGSDMTKLEVPIVAGYQTQVGFACVSGG